MSVVESIACCLSDQPGTTEGQESWRPNKEQKLQAKQNPLKICQHNVSIIICLNITKLQLFSGNVKTVKYF